MDILFLNHNVAWSRGTFFRAFGFARALASRGHRLTLLSISSSSRFTMASEWCDGVEIVTTPDWFWGRGRSGWDPWDTLCRIRRTVARRWDIVHAWDARPAVIIPALIAARTSTAPGARLILDWCDWWGRGGTQAERTERWMALVAPLETLFEERFRTAADGTTVISSALRQRALSLGVNARRILFLPQGCMPPRHKGECEGTRERLGLGRGDRLLVSVGALSGSDATLLFGAVRAILAARADCHFCLIGRHGAVVPSDLRGHPRFRELGFVSSTDLQAYTDACDASIVPLADTLASRARWPSKVNPFLSSGRATVVTRVGDLPALLEREGAAAVVDPTEEGLIAGVLDLLADRHAQRRISERARAIAEGELAWATLAARLETFYERRETALPHGFRRDMCGENGLDPSLVRGGGSSRAAAASDARPRSG